MDSPIQHHTAALPAPQQQPTATRSSESKPRLSKEAQDLLERHFAAEPKPSTNTKKGFAGEIGVPLDKINNWFQNRRAKVKQDARKARNQQSYDLFYHNGFSSDGLNTESFINPSFYTTVDPGMPHPILVNDPGMQMPPEMLIAPFQTAPQFVQALPAQPHPQQPAMPAQHMANYTYNPEPEMTHFFGLGNGAVANGQAIDPNSVAAFGDQFKQQYIAVPGAVDLDAYPRAHSLYTMHSDDSMQCQPGGFPMQIQQPSSSMTSMTTGYSTASRKSSASWASDAEAAQMPFNLRTLRKRMDSMNPGSVNQTVMEEPVADFDALHPSDGISMSDDSLTATTAIQDFRKQMKIDISTPATCVPSALFHHAAPESASSQSDHLSPTFSVDSEAGPSPTNTITPRTSNSSSLALRRQKRPAALDVMHRSTSYSNATTPQSPSSLVPGDGGNTIRRIKSSHPVMSGRIQKSGSTSAQRSPMTLSFREGDGPRQYASASRLNDKAETNSIVEHEAEDVDVEMDPSSIWHHMPSTAGTSFSSGLWSQGPTTGESTSFTSAPPTPLDLSTFEQMRMRNASIPTMSHMVPSSAPPWQESFSSDVSAGPDMVLDPALSFRPATSAGPESMMMPTEGPGFMQILPDGMMTADDLHRQSIASQVPVYAMHTDISMMPPPPLIVPSSELSSTPRLGPKLHIQAWEPRGVPEETDLPPKRASASLPKNYQFNNQFSTTFISPSAG